ncbi:Ninja-family protein [Carex littledalei]|uniref:Ninja-family protein n=1 Tax=Carex littledalei TaxID=544730 RepID=A0A833VF42_9POAL|nr:Ninja-family protein [Carex littledalei]
MRVLDLNESEADTDLDLTLSLSVGDSSQKRAVVAEPIPEIGTHIAKLRNSEPVRNYNPSTGGKSSAMLGSGAPTFSPFHAKMEEVSAGAGSSSAVLSEESRSVQGSNTLCKTKSNLCPAAVRASPEQHQLTPNPSIHSFPSFTNTNNTNGNISTISHLPCVTVRDSGLGTHSIRGFISQVSIAADVTIVCACHWHCFSPSGFVEHAGLTNVENPLRQIVVLPP